MTIEQELEQLVEVVNKKAKEFYELYGKNNLDHPAKKELDQVLNTFNNSFIEWMHKYKAVANFMFDYKGGKKLVIQDIIIPVYQREAPTAQQILKKMQGGGDGTSKKV